MKSLRALALSLLVCVAAVAQNAALMPVPKMQFFDANGYPLAGGFVYTCVAGSSCPGTPAATFTDSTAGTANPNPIPLDGGGFAAIWLGSAPIKVVVESAAGVVISTTDNVTNNGLSLVASNGAASVKYTPSATGGQTRTLAAIQYDSIDAGNYDTITHAFADACASTPGKLVVIPSTIAASQTYINSCGAPTQDYRFGTSTVPNASRTFVTPMFGGTVYDASPLTTNPLSQGDGSYAPINLLRVFETGGATAAALYTEYHAGPGATGGAYGLASNVSADPGSDPTVVADNWTIQDATHYWITGCTRTSNVSTCTTSTSSPNVSLTLPTGGINCIYVTGTTADASFENAGFEVCPTAFTANSVTFNQTGPNSTIGAGGWISPNHQDFSFELNINNAAHDPGHLTPVSGQNTFPFWGFVSTPTPFTWGNPTGAAGIPNLPITAGYFASYGAGQYNGFVAENAIDDLFVAGYPVQGNGPSTAKSGFRARPQGVATNGTNYSSQKSCWDKSVWNSSTSSYGESSFCVQYVPASNSANASGTFQITTPNATLYITDAGQIISTNASAGAPSFSFAGDGTSGLYRDSTGNVGIAVAGGEVLQIGGGQMNANVALNLKNGLQVNGTSGYSGTVTCGTGTHISGITVTNGVVTAVGACN